MKKITLIVTPRSKALPVLLRTKIGANDENQYNSSNIKFGTDGWRGLLPMTLPSSRMCEGNAGDRFTLKQSVSKDRLFSLPTIPSASG